jgi:hypothetical protein
VPPALPGTAASYLANQLLPKATAASDIVGSPPIIRHSTQISRNFELEMARFIKHIATRSTISQ